MIDFLADRLVLLVNIFKHIFKYAVIFFIIVFVYMFIKNSITKLREKHGQQRKD